VGNAHDNEWSEEFHFVSPPLPPSMLTDTYADSPALAKLAIVADVGISYHAQSVLTSIRDDNVDAVVHIGDFAYSIPRAKGNQRALLQNKHSINKVNLLNLSPRLSVVSKV